MKAASNSLKHIQEYFSLKLLNQFDKSTINQYFYWCTAYFLGMSKMDVLAHPNTLLTESEILKFHYAAKQLMQNKPIQYVVGKTSFYYSEFDLDENVLIPRPETEELVDWIVKDNPKGVVLDIGTGSGCIAVSLAKFLPNCKVFGIDVSAKAISVAEKNAQKNKVNIQFLQADILTINLNELLLQKVEVIVSNPPYIPLKDKAFMEENVLGYEPDLALFVEDENPLLFYQKILEQAYVNLNPNGRVYFEIHEDFAIEIKELAIHNGFKSVEIRKDLQGKNRMVKCEIID